MATSTGKTVALILLVVLILFVGWRLTPLFIAPLGIFSGPVHILRTSSMKGLHFWPYPFHISPLSILSLALLILWIIVIIWVYRDAERRGMNGVLWALLVLIGNLIGLLIYLIVRTDNVPISQSSQTAQACPSCQKTSSASFTFCPHCGTRFQELCPACGKPIERTWNICPHCGEKLNKEQSAG